MKSIQYYPKNKEYFKSLFEYAKRVFSICEKLNIQPIATGSLAYAAHTQDHQIEIHDIDFMVDKSNFPAIIIELSKQDDITYRETEYNSINTHWKGTHISFDSIAHYYTDLEMNQVDVVINGIPFSIIGYDELIEVYKRGRDTIEIKRDEYQQKLDKLSFFLQNKKTDYNEIMNEMRRSYDIAGKNYLDLFQDDILEHPYDQELLNDFVKGFGEKPIICDMGCGPAGQYGGFVIDKCKKVYSLDISHNNLTLANKKFPFLSCRCEDMINTSFDDNELDGIISFYAVFHIPKNKTLDLFKEFFRILKPGGKALIVSHKGDMNRVLTEMWGHEDLFLFANFHMENELAEPAKEAGFMIDEIYAKETYYPFPEERVILKIQKSIGE
jgi:SAM-dependent methyltransferase